MECTKCHKCLHKDEFSFKNLKQKIYYLHCDKCREKVQKNADKKQREKEQYNLIKETNVIICDCGKKYISFRTYHTIRHMNSSFHKNVMSKK